MEGSLGQCGAVWVRVRVGDRLRDSRGKSWWSWDSLGAARGSKRQYGAAWEQPESPGDKLGGFLVQFVAWRQSGDLGGNLSGVLGALWGSLGVD